MNIKNFTKNILTIIASISLIYACTISPKNPKENSKGKNKESKKENNKGSKKNNTDKKPEEKLENQSYTTQLSEEVSTITNRNYGKNYQQIEKLIKQAIADNESEFKEKAFEVLNTLINNLPLTSKSLEQYISPSKKIIEYIIINKNQNKKEIEELINLIEDKKIGKKESLANLYGELISSLKKLLKENDNPEDKVLENEINRSEKSSQGDENKNVKDEKTEIENKDKDNIELESNKSVKSETGNKEEDDKSEENKEIKNDPKNPNLEQNKKIIKDALGSIKDNREEKFSKNFQKVVKENFETIIKIENTINDAGTQNSLNEMLTIVLKKLPKSAPTTYEITYVLNFIQYLKKTYPNFHEWTPSDSTYKNFSELFEKTINTSKLPKKTSNIYTNIQAALKNSNKNNK